LLGYGGHFAAAGLTLELDKVEAFRNKFEEVVAATIDPDLLIPEIEIDAELSFSEISWSFYNILLQLEPYGPDNLRPVFISKKVSDTGFTKIVKEDHIRFSFKQNNIVFTGIGFNMAEKFALFQTKKPVDIVYTIDENEWNGNKSLQLRMIDLRISEY
jgi:single-stranded-DNA-specific exonuclease